MPYAPGIQYHGDEFMFRGIQQAGASIARSIEKYRDQAKLENDEAKVWRQVNKLRPKGEELIDPVKAEGMSSREVNAIGRANLQKMSMDKEAQAYAKGQMDMAAVGAQIMRLKQQDELAQNNDAVRLAQDKAITGYAQNLSRNTLEEYYQNPEGMSPLAASAAQALFNHPNAATHPQFDNLMRSFTPSSASGPMQFEEDPVSGMRFGRRGNTVLPSGINPARVQDTPEGTFVDPKGNVRNKPKTEMNTLDRLRILNTQLRALGAGAGAISNEKEIKRLNGEIDTLLNGDDDGTGAPAKAESAKPLSLEQAKEFLKKAAGDKEKARKLAKEAGYEF
jgi:hypothetical protein